MMILSSFLDDFISSLLKMIFFYRPFGTIFDHPLEIISSSKKDNFSSSFQGMMIPLSKKDNFISLFLETMILSFFLDNFTSSFPEMMISSSKRDNITLSFLGMMFSHCLFGMIFLHRS